MFLFYRLLPENCYINKKDFEHGEKQILGCRNCSCIDGNMMCDMLQCPELKCPPEQQMSVTDECCKFCQGIVGAHQLRHYEASVRVDADGSVRTMVRHQQRSTSTLAQEEQQEEVQEQGRIFVLESDDQGNPAIILVGANSNSNSHESFVPAEKRELELPFDSDELEQRVRVEETEPEELRQATFDTKFVEDRENR